MGKNETIEVTVTYEHHTAKAVLVTDGDDEKIWLPRSQVTTEEEYRNLNPGAVIVLEIPEWLAEDKGLV